MTDAETEIRLLRATLQELREALQKCGCGRVATHQQYDEMSCDRHAEKYLREMHETPWAAVARRLGW